MKEGDSTKANGSLIGAALCGPLGELDGTHLTRFQCVQFWYRKSGPEMLCTSFWVILIRSNSLKNRAAVLPRYVRPFWGRTCLSQLERCHQCVSRAKFFVVLHLRLC